METDKPESDVTSSDQAVCDATKPEAGAGNGEARAEWPWKRAKKVAVMISFAGKNYFGMQRNPPHPTIEEELLRSFRDAGSIAPEWLEAPQKAFFQRASRTDKGVSAARMVVSLKMLNEPGMVESINSHLPADIRVQGIKRVTKNFNSKNNCDARTYLYMTPTFAMCPLETVTTESYRLDAETRDKMNKTLQNFVGVHYFHNYTSGKLPMEPSSQRNISVFEMGEPFEKGGLEFAVIKVKGQSFMLHQIRKMIGKALAIVRGHASQEVIESTWKMDRIDVPRAPGLGLMLDEIHYERYNKKFGKDGTHEPMSWDECSDAVERFKDDIIFADMVETEAESKSMIDWLKFLHMHTFTPRHFENEEPKTDRLRTAYIKACKAADMKPKTSDERGAVQWRNIPLLTMMKQKKKK